MSLPVEFLAGADADLQEIFNRFEDYREGFGVEFMIAVDAHLARIAVFPDLAPRYIEKVRRQVMQGFPYGVFYEPYPTRVLVTAILDLRQDPEKIRRRVEP
jgi:hypothetical protein